MKQRNLCFIVFLLKVKPKDTDKSEGHVSRSNGYLLVLAVVLMLFTGPLFNIVDVAGESGYLVKDGIAYNWANGDMKLSSVYSGGGA